MCILVIIGADKEGNKELVAVGDGYRESTTSWKEVLLDLRRRGLKNAPRYSRGICTSSVDNLVNGRGIVAILV